MVVPGAAPVQIGGRTTVASSLLLRDAARLKRYAEYQGFYEGRHFERQRNGRSSLVLNYARTIVDKGVAYLLGRGITWSVEPSRPNNAEARRRANAVEQLLYDVAAANDVDAVDLQVAQNAGVLGDGVYKVLWSQEEARVRIVSVDPRTFFATWAGDDPGTLRRVECVYRLGAEDLALGGYGLGEGEAAALVGSDGLADVVERWTASELEILVRNDTVRRGANPYGFIPFVHVPNLPLANESWGQSDLVDVIPINREINERVSDQADVIRFHADPPVVFKGVNDREDLAVGPGSVWDLPIDADVKLLEWQGQPVAVQEHIERLYRTLYEVTETPRTSFGDAGGQLTGVALEIQLRPVIQRTLRRRVWWGRALRQRAMMTLRLIDRYHQRRVVVSPDDYRVRVIWPPMLPRDDAQEVRNQTALVAAGLRSHRTAMDVIGTESPEEELTRVVEDRATLGEATLTPRPPLPQAGEGESDSDVPAGTAVV